MSPDQQFDGSGAELLPANPAECVALLREFNEWRRWDGEIDEEGPVMPHPKEIGLAIDMAIQLIEQHHADVSTLEQESKQVRARIERMENERNALLASAKDVVVRWHSHLWNQEVGTATYIRAMEDAIAKVQP